MLKFLKLNENKQPMTKLDVTYPSMEGLENAGLLLNNNVVVVDFDNDNAEEEKIIKYLKNNYPTLTVYTDKGVHFYYSKPANVSFKSKADVITVGGFQVDYKTGNKQYAIVKRSGKERERNQDLTLTSLPEMPQILWQLPVKPNLSGMRETDGRNNGMNSHLYCIKQLYPDLDIAIIGKYINENIFAEPLDNKELDRIVQSVLESDPLSNMTEYTGNKKEMITFAKWITKKLDIKLYQNQLYFKSDNKHIGNDTMLLREITKYNELSRQKDNELRHQLYKYAEIIDVQAHHFYIRVRNGIMQENNVVDIDCGFTPFFLDVNYDPTAYDEHVDKFLNDISCNRLELREFLEEIIGHCLLVNKFPHAVFFLNGGGKNGKSTFVTMLSNFAKGLTNHISLSRFEDDTSILSLNGKILNISDDVNSSYIEKSEKLKLMSAGNDINIRPIYSHTSNFKNTATFILTANEMPVFKDKSNGFYRRILLIPFDFVVDKRIPDLDDLLSTDKAKSYILNLALKGITRIINNGYELTENEIVKGATEEYIADTDSIYSFLQDNGDINGKWFKEVYLKYQMYCEENDKELLERPVFSRKLKNYGYCTGKEERVKAGKDRKIHKK